MLVCVALSGTFTYSAPTELSNYCNYPGKVFLFPSDVFTYCISHSSRGRAFKFITEMREVCWLWSVFFFILFCWSRKRNFSASVCQGNQNNWLPVMHVRRHLHEIEPSSTGRLWIVWAALSCGSMFFKIQLTVNNIPSHFQHFSLYLWTGCESSQLVIFWLTRPRLFCKFTTHLVK